MPEKGATRLGVPLAFLLVMTVGYAVYAADRTVLSSVLVPMSQALNLSNAEVGLLGSAQYVGVLAVTFVAGHLSDRYGRRKVVLIGLLVFTAFTWLVGLSTDFYTAFLLRLVSGVGEGVFWPVAMAAVADFFQSRRGLALGVFYDGFDIGSVAGLSIGGVAFYTSGSWREAFFFAPLVGVISIAGVYYLRGTFVRAEAGTRTFTMGRDAAELLARGEVRLIMFFAFLATWASVWQVVFLPYYFVRALHFAILPADVLSSLVAVSGGAGKLILGAGSDSWRRARTLTLLSVAVVAVYGVFFLAPSPLVSLAAALAMGFVSAAVFPIVQALASERYEGMSGTVLGLTTTAQSVAAVLAPTIAGYLFVLGVGRSLAADAMVPSAAMALVAFLLSRRER